MERHILVDKQLTSTPKNWREWLEQFHSSNNSLTLISLLRYGPVMVSNEDWDYKSSQSADILYLQLAKGIHCGPEIFSEESDHYNKKRTIINCPKTVLSKTAFKVLCKYCFTKSRFHDMPWTEFVYSRNLLEELIVFLGLDSLEIKPGKDEFHSLICYAGKYEDILREFCLGLAKHLIEMPFYTHISDSQKKEMTTLWRSHRKSAVKVLWYFDELENVLIENRELVDESILGPLRELILNSHEEIPIYSRRLKKDIWKKPKLVTDLLKIKPDNFFLRNSHKTIRAALLYVGLTYKP